MVEKLERMRVESDDYKSCDVLLRLLAREKFKNEDLLGRVIPDNPIEWSSDDAIRDRLGDKLADKGFNEWAAMDMGSILTAVWEAVCEVGREHREFIAELEAKSHEDTATT